MGDAYAVVIGIEKYQQSGLSGTNFAHADAREFAAVLEERFNVPKDHIKVWLDQDATFASVTSQLKAVATNLSKDDRFYFFYAGHGFWAPKGGNRLTAWDTQLTELQKSTVSLEDALLAPLRQSRCQQSAIFIDACSMEIHEDLGSRDVIGEMDVREFNEFVKNNQYAAAFFACSPGEKSYSSPKLKHGVWTYHLLRALRGEISDALFKEKFITGSSLQDYLLKAVKKFTREEFVRKAAVQTPFARFSQNSTFVLVEMPEEEKPNDLNPLLTPDFSSAYFVGEDARPFKDFPDFTWKKKHTVPSEYSDSAASWAQRLLKSDIARELQEIAVAARKILKIKSSEIDKKEDSVSTDTFRIDLEANQSRADPAETVLRRELRLRVPHKKLPKNFDDIFSENIDSFIVSIPGTKGRYGELLDAIETKEEEGGLTSEGDQTKQTIELRLADGTQLFIDTKHETMTVKPASANGCLSIIEYLGDDAIASLAGSPPKLVGKKSDDE